MTTSTSTLRARAIREHACRLDDARFWRTPLLMLRAAGARYEIQGACRKAAAHALAHAAQARDVYAHADEIVRAAA